MAYKEDDLTEGLIENYQKRDHIRIIEPEAHYDHYGHRGWPDLFAVFLRPDEGLVEYHLIEVKSEYAVKAATGANEIIRQFNQMRRYFYEDDRHHVMLPEFESREIVLVFELTFIPTEHTVSHIFSNKRMYTEAITSDSPNPWEKLPSDQTNTGIHSGIEVSLTLRHPNNPENELELISGHSGRTRYMNNKDPQTLLNSFND